MWGYSKQQARNKMNNRMLVGVMFLLACSRKIPGTEGGPCLNSGTCDEGFQCLSNTCVSTSSTAGGGTGLGGGLQADGSTGGSGGGVPVDAQLMIMPVVNTVIATSFVLTGSVNASFMATKLEFKKGGDAYQETPLSNGLFSATVMTPDIDAKTIEYSVRATNAQGATLEGSIMVKVDRKAPVLTLKSPTAGVLVGGLMSQIVVSVQDAAPVSNVKINNIIAAPAAAAGEFQATIPLPQGQTRMLAVEFSAEDEGGNNGTGMAMISIDTEAPVITFVSPEMGALFGGPAAPTIAVSVNATDAKTVTVNGTPTTGTGPYLATLAPPSGQDFVDFELTAMATDAVGNSATLARTVKVDNVAPRVTITSPAMDQKFNIAQVAVTNNDVVLNWTILENAPTTREIKVRANLDMGAYVPIAATTLRVPTDPYDNAGYLGTREGRYTAELKITDTAGNLGTALVGWKVDRIRPSVYDRTPSPGAPIQQYDGTISVTFDEPILNAVGIAVVTTDPDAPLGSIVSTWDTYHKIATLEGLPPGTPLQITVPSDVTDTFGNPIETPLPAPVSVFTKVKAPQIPLFGSLLTGVTDFKVASDKYGLAILVYKTATSNNAAWLKPDGTLAAPFLTDPNLARNYEPYAYSWNGYRVTGVQDKESNSAAQQVFSGYPWKPPGTPVLTPTSLPFSVVFAPPLEGEDGTDALGLWRNFTYERHTDGAPGLYGTTGGTSVLADRIQPGWVVSSPRRWTGAIEGFRSIGFKEWQCDYNNQACAKQCYSCAMATFSVGTNIVWPKIKSQVMSPSGTCVFISTNEPKTYAISIENRICSGLNCGSPSANPTSLQSPNMTFAPFTGQDATQDAIFATRFDDLMGQRYVEYAKQTIQPGCELRFPVEITPDHKTEILPNGAKFQIVQLGTRMALMYLDGTNLNVRYLTP
jgi:hypothetical protein